MLVIRPPHHEVVLNPYSLSATAVIKCCPTQRGPHVNILDQLECMHVTIHSPTSMHVSNMYTSTQVTMVEGCKHGACLVK